MPGDAGLSLSNPSRAGHSRARYCLWGTTIWLKASCKLFYYVVCTQNVKWFMSTHHVRQVVVSKIPKPSTTTESALLVAGRRRRRRRQLTTQTNSFTINRGVCLILPEICGKGIIDVEKVEPFCRKINIFGTWQEMRDWRCESSTLTRQKGKNLVLKHRIFSSVRIYCNSSVYMCLKQQLQSAGHHLLCLVQWGDAWLGSHASRATSFLSGQPTAHQQTGKTLIGNDHLLTDWKSNEL